MNKMDLLSEISGMIRENASAVLATVDRDRAPHIRWVTPGCLRDRPGAVFMLSSPQFSKVEHARENPLVELMLQSRALDKVINVRGHSNVIENPSICSEVLETIGNRLHAFWKINSDPTKMVVLELLIEEATFYSPMKGTRLTINYT
jgi:general stress protein 26